MAFTWVSDTKGKCVTNTATSVTTVRPTLHLWCRRRWGWWWRRCWHHLVQRLPCEDDLRNSSSRSKRMQEEERECVCEREEGRGGRTREGTVHEGEDKKESKQQHWLYAVIP